MNPLSLTWHLLSIIGNLPEELIIKILYQYGGMRHPIVNILLESTKNKEYEDLQKLPFSKSIYKFYLNKEKYSNLFGVDIINYINNKQHTYFRECISYTHYEDPGYFFPRQFGRLYYNVLNENINVDMNRQIDWSEHINLKKTPTSFKKWGENFRKDWSIKIYCDGCKNRAYRNKCVKNIYKCL